MKRASGLIALALLVGALPAAAQDRTARIDRFVAALPAGQTGPGVEDDAADRQETARLIAANPGKEAAINAARRTLAQCTTEVGKATTTRALHRAAELLSDAELDQLTAFYTGPDYAQVAKSDSEAELAAMAKRYPLQRFMETMQKAMADMPGAAFDGFATCDAAAEASLAKAGVKTD